MTLTLFVMMVLPFHLAAVMNPDGAQKILNRISKTDEEHVFISMMLFIIAMLLFSSNFSFELEWSNLISYIGALLMVKGLLWLFLPSHMKKLVKKVADNFLPAFPFLLILVDFGLIYVDTQIL